jgi:acetolactate synthase I/II/III large subunit
MDKTTGGRIVATMLREEGVDTIFGIVDGTYLQLFASCVELGMRMVTPRHESTGMHMAGAYARLTGRLGVCIASNGPGVANVLPGVAVENGEGNRVLLLTSCRRPQIIYPDRGGAYQTFDQVGVIRAMSKWSETVMSADRLPELTRAALRACHQGRPGVVHLDLPETIINGTLDAVPLPPPHLYRRSEPIEPSPSLVDRAAELLSEAKLPIIHAGSGVIHARAFEELAELAELLHAPVTTSWAARGVLSERSELAFPMVHIEAVDAVRNRADVVLSVGSDLGETDWWGKPPNWKVPAEQRWVQVDVDEACLGRNRPADLPILGDARVFLRQLIERLRERRGAINLAARRKAVAELAAARDAHRRALDEALQDRGVPMLTAHVGAVCRKLFDDDAIMVFDGGNTAVWGNFYSQVRVPNTQLGTHHFGHLGAGAGQAMGAAVARPRSQVFCITGDGAMGFHPQEIETAIRNDLRVIFLVCCDRQWGMVKLTESLGLDPVRTLARKFLGAEGKAMELPWKVPAQLEKATTKLLGPLKDAVSRSLGAVRTVNADLGEIRWDDLARSMGAHGERVADPVELEPALQRCLAAGKAAVVHVDVDRDKHLWAPGLKYFKAMHQEPKGRK